MTTTSTIQSLSAQLSVAMASVTAMIGTVTSISNATVNYQTELLDLVNDALAISQSLQAALDAALSAAGSPAMFASGSTPQAMIAAMQNLSTLSNQMAACVRCTNMLARMSKNIGQIGQ